MVWLDRRREIVVEMPEEWGGIVPSEVFLSEGRRLVEEASKRNIVMRLMGGVAIRIHTENISDFAKKIGRMTGKGQEFTDLDFMAYRRQRKLMPGFFESLGYVKRVTTLSSAASERQIYYHGKGWFHVDVFFDVLRMNHDIDFRGRLEVDYPTISVSDLLLEKMQIVFISEKDLKDACVLIRGHDVGEGDEECVNAKYIASLLSKDWGFWYTVTTNLKKLRKLAPSFGVKGGDLKDVNEKIDVLMEYIEKERKSAKWGARAKLGTMKKWYRPVETPETVGGFGIETLGK